MAGKTQGKVDEDNTGPVTGESRLGRTTGTHEEHKSYHQTRTKLKQGRHKTKDKINNTKLKHYTKIHKDQICDPEHIYKRTQFSLSSVYSCASSDRSESKETPTNIGNPNNDHTR